ncbi:MAG: hypothetical protein IKE55_02585 [Kiritimatiellae bacterium]|nr:hypothetical protein [Kiritimatiellia bacterium]
MIIPILLAAGVAACPGQKQLRLDRGKFLIGAYSTEKTCQGDADAKAMAEGGLDYVFGPIESKNLDNFARHGVGVVRTGCLPWWWGGAAEVTNGQMHVMRPLAEYEKAMDRFEDHPAIVGIDIGDEPSGLDFEHYGKIARLVSARRPDKFTYVNLFPNYASAASLTLDEAQSQLGTPDYRTYIERYCRYFDLDYICFDSYIWGWGNTPSVLFENLRVVGDACTATARSLWVVLQANVFQEGDKVGRGPITENMLRFQAHAAMAFGAEMISWACWTGWWKDNVCDKQGRLTAQYARVRDVNRELHALGAHTIKYRRTITDFVGFDASPNGLKGVLQSPVGASNGPAFTDVKSADGAALLVGHFLAKDGSSRHAVFLAACDDPHDEGGREHVVRFRADGRVARAYGPRGEVKLAKSAEGVCSVPLRSNEALFVEAE